jgi:isopentenyldiphosphate isomerase
MWNLYIVADENDNIIWYKPREEIDPVKEFYRTAWLRIKNSHWEILIAQRSLNKRLGAGKRWPAVAGTLEEGESYEENIIKEMEEELWITNTPFTIWPKIKRESKTKYFIQRFFATVDKDISEFKIQEEEVEAIKRISAEELKKDIEAYPENYISIMRRYVEEFSK